MEKKIHSIRIMKAKDLDIIEQIKLGYFTGFVELRCEGNPPKTRIIPLTKCPATILREEFHKAGIHKI